MEQEKFNALRLDCERKVTRQILLDLTLAIWNFSWLIYFEIRFPEYNGLNLLVAALGVFALISAMLKNHNKSLLVRVSMLRELTQHGDNIDETNR